MMTTRLWNFSAFGIFIFFFTIRFSAGLQCYNCEWMDMEGMNPANCKDGQTSSPTGEYADTADATAYCLTVSGVMESMSHDYGLRTGFAVKNDVTYEDGQCTSELPADFHHMEKHIDGVKVSQVCYCKTSRCNTKPFSSGASQTVGLMAMVPIILFVLTLSFYCTNN